MPDKQILDFDLVNYIFAIIDCQVLFWAIFSVISGAEGLQSVQ